MSHEDWTYRERPMFIPHECTVTHRTDDPEGFVDCNTELDGMRVCVSFDGIRRLAAFAGLEDARVTELNEQLLEANGKLAELQGEVDRLEGALDMVTALKRTNLFTEQRKSGQQRGIGQKTAEERLAELEEPEDDERRGIGPEDDDTVAELAETEA